MLQNNPCANLKTLGSSLDTYPVFNIQTHGQMERWKDIARSTKNLIKTPTFEVLNKYLDTLHTKW